MKRVALVFVFVFILLLLQLKKEKYTESDQVRFALYFKDNDDTALKRYIAKSIVNELDNNRDLELSNVNLIIDTLNTSYIFNHYSSVAELDTMFETAYTSGESGLGTRDRMILRTFAWPGIDPYLSTFTYTSDGVPDFTSTTVTESGKTTKDLLKYCFVIADAFYDTENGTFTPEVLNYINSVLPDKYAPKFDLTTLQNAFNSPVPDEKTMWLFKALNIGPAYLGWLAKNKWKLDLNWNP